MKKTAVIIVVATLAVAVVAVASNKKDENTEPKDKETIKTEQKADNDETKEIIHGTEIPGGNYDPEDENDVKETDKQETEPEENEPADFSAFKGDWVLNGQNIRVQSDGSWDYTSSDTNAYGTMTYEDGEYILLPQDNNYFKTHTIYINESGNLEISDIGTFFPKSQQNNPSTEVDMSVFEGEWYLDGNVDSKYFYRVNRDGTWTQFEKSEDGTGQIESGSTETTSTENKFSLITTTGYYIIAEYEPTEDAMYINGEKYIKLS